MPNWVYRILKCIFWLMSHIRWEGIGKPFWFTLNPNSFQLKARHYREVEKLIKPGDILVRRFEGWIDKWFIPGWWNHGAVYVGDHKGKPHQVIHAMSEGVIATDLIDFMRSDHMMILRLEEVGDDWVKYALKTAVELEGKPYDFVFNFKDDREFSCTEFVAKCYPGLIRGKRRFGRGQTIIADDIVANTNSEQHTDRLYVVWDSRKTSYPI